MSWLQGDGGGKGGMGREDMFCINGKDILGTLFVLNRLPIRKFRIGISFGIMGLFIDFPAQVAMLVHDIPYGMWK